MISRHTAYSETFGPFTHADGRPVCERQTKCYEDFAVHFGWTVGAYGCHDGLVIKSKTFSATRFDADVLREGLQELLARARKAKAEVNSYVMTIEHDDNSSWSYDTVEEFWADYRRYKRHAYFARFGNGFDLTVTQHAREAKVEVKSSARVDIEAVFEVFEKNAARCKLPDPPPEVVVENPPVVFIGHGRSQTWRDLKDHLHEKHHYPVEAYETGARAGHTIRDVLEDMVEKSSFAVLVMTGEDEQANGQLRARQNVIHEAGLFQGRLGFSKAIMLLENGVEEFSNVQGVQYIRFSKGGIKETFGEVLATLRREFAR